MFEIIVPAIIAMVASHQDMPKGIKELPDRYADIFTLTKSPRRRETHD